MSTVIWKYTLDIHSLMEEMPRDAKILSTAVQGDEICVWAVVDPEAPREMVHFEVYGTGHDIPCASLCNRRFIGTVLMRGGALVLHVFVKE